MKKTLFTFIFTIISIVSFADETITVFGVPLNINKDKFAQEVQKRGISYLDDTGEMLVLFGDYSFFTGVGMGAWYSPETNRVFQLVILSNKYNTKKEMHRDFKRIVMELSGRYGQKPEKYSKYDVRFSRGWDWSIYVKEVDDNIEINILDTKGYLNYKYELQR